MIIFCPLLLEMIAKHLKIRYLIIIVLYLEDSLGGEVVALGISRKIIAFTSLLVFVLAIYGSAFGSIGCHSTGEGFQSVECNKAHHPHADPHITDDTKNLCACDQLACRILESRTRVKRHIAQVAPFVTPAPVEISPSLSARFSGRHDRASLHLPSQSLVLLRTVVLLH